MSALNQHISIPKNVSTNDDLSFEFLRTKGIEYIESLGSKFWTDYNTHDPGITILEVLCYAITDLGMRINLPIEDLLNENYKSSEKQFFKGSEILPSQAVTALDYRKILIDIDPNIKNCWLQKTTKKLYINCKEGKISLKKEDFAGTLDSFIKQSEIKGYYNILVDFEEIDVAKKSILKTKIIEKFYENRNLCEDILEVREVEIQPIAVCALIEINPEANEEYVHALITLELEKYLSPTIKQYSLVEMFEKGYSSDQIYEGPFLDNGFIDTTELENAELKTEVRLSDIMQIIMNVEGVTVIKDIALNNCEAIETEGSVWNICIPANKKPSLCSKSTLNFSKGILPVTVNKVKAKKYLEDLKEELEYSQQNAAKNRELQIPQGKIIESDFYTSVTNNFPENYGIGEVGLSESAGIERKAKAKQLKGYLLFFDQILASYFKHLSNVKELLSINNKLPNTYFTQSITDMTDFNEIVNKEYQQATKEEKLDELLFEDLDDAIKRKNQIKDHLIARFAERFAEYAFLMKSLYGASSDEIVLQNKSDFLINYDTISSQRGSAFNYFNQPLSNLWDTFNVTGLENRIAGLLGIKGDKNLVTGKRGIKRKNISGLFVQLYDPSPGMLPNRFRWRIRNSANKIILTATEDYLNQSTAVKEMYFSILKIYETSEKKIEQVFEELLKDKANGIAFKDTVISTFEVIESNTHKYSFHIINPEFANDISNPDRIIARQYKLYSTLEEVKKAILDLLLFFKEEFSDEGIFLVEHILLVPNPNEVINESYYMPICVDDCSGDCCIPNPYSFKISVVLPGYTYRFADVDFRNFAENVIRQEIPSHILGKICWIGYRKDHITVKDNDLVDFEKDFKKFLMDKTQNKQGSLPKFIKSLTKLNSIYPTGTLYNCADEEEVISGKIVLGRTNLGTL